MLINLVRNAKSSGNSTEPTAPRNAVATRAPNSAGSETLKERSSFIASRSVTSVLPSQQTVRKHEYDQNDREIEEEFAVFWRQIFSCRIGEAEKDRSRQGAHDGSGAADRNHHKECNHVSQRIERFDREKLSTDHAAERRQADCERESGRKDDLRPNPQRFRHVAIVDRRAQTYSEFGPIDQQPQQTGRAKAACHHEKPMGRNHPEAEIERTAQGGRQRYRLRGWSEDEIGDADDDERDSDRKEYLSQLVRPTIYPAVEQEFDRNRDSDGTEKGEDDCQGIADADALERVGRQIAADHRKCAMREVHDSHQPHHDRQADGDDEEHHPVGDGIQADAESRPRHQCMDPAAADACEPITSCSMAPRTMVISTLTDLRSTEASNGSLSTAMRSAAIPGSRTPLQVSCLMA